jgi:phage terminase Nu1 subunit (DNA packaging protein)
MSELTRAQLCASMGVSDSTVGRWLLAGLPYTPVGVRGKRFDLAECRAWLREQYQPCQPGQTNKAAATSASWSPAAVFTESCRRVQLRVTPSAQRPS